MSHAEWLVGSSEVLWQRISGHFDNSTSRRRSSDERDARHGPAFLLLFGFGLEATLKAAALQVELNAGGIHRVLVMTPAPRVQTWLKTHRLEALANRAGVSYAADELLYLRRFETHLRWAGRYPVPLAPNPTVPRGFDYQLGMQDRAIGRVLVQRARDVYERARSVDGAWKEPDGVGDYRDREAQWMAASTKWLTVVRSLLIEHALRMAGGERGVMQLSIDTSEIQAHLKATTTTVRLDPIWLPMEEFISIVGSREGVGHDTAERWANTLAAMDPRKDVALFLCSRPDDDGRWFSRYVFLRAAGEDGA
jgi:hypothetical protein